MELYILSATLLLINVLTLIQHASYVKETNKNTKDLLKALMAKNLPELDAVTRTEEPFELPQDTQDEYIPMVDALNDEEIFKKMVANKFKSE